jgi:hypothetical protein
MPIEEVIVDERREVSPVKGPSAAAPAGGYREIDVRFAASASAGGLQVRVDTPAGASEWQELALPLGAAEAERLAHRALLAAAQGRRGEEPARRLGQALFTALFARQVLGRYHATVGASRTASPPLRLCFHLGAGSAEEAALHRLPWELLCEPGHGDGRLLALDRHLSVVRHLTVADGVATLPRPPRLRVLVAAAEGRAPGVEPLDLGGEVDAIRAACGDGSAVAVETLRPATLEGVIERLRGGGFHVLHLSGHGDLAGDDGVVLLPDAGGRLVPWHGERLAAQLDGLSPLRLVVLNSCRTAEAVAGRPFAGVAGAFLARGLPAVAAMQAPVTDAAAAAFATAVYARLAAGEGLDAAVSEGRLAVSRRRPHTFEWAVPVLFSRLPGGELFTAPAAGDETGRASGGVEVEAKERSGGDSAGAAGRRLATSAHLPRAPSSAARWLLALLSLVVFVVMSAVAPRRAVEDASDGELVVGPAAAGGEVASPAGVRGPTVPPGEGVARADPVRPPAAGAPGDLADSGEPPGPEEGTTSTAADGAARQPSGTGALAAVAGAFCGPIRTLPSGEAVEVPELDATLVPRILDHPGLGAYVTVTLLGPGARSHRTTNRPDSLDFRGDAPLLVRVLGFDAVAGTVRLSCRLVG